MDPGERLLMRAGERISLSPKSFDLLFVLLQNSGHLIDKKELLKLIWPGTFVEEANISVHVAALRRALGDPPGSSSYIETVPGRGYRFLADVREVMSAPPGEVSDSFANSSDAERPNSPAGVRPEQEEGKTATQKTAAREALSDTLSESHSRFRSLRWLLSLFVLAVGAILGGLVLVRPYLTQRGEIIHSIAILPFVNVSEDPGVEYLSEGLSDAIINNLSQLPGLRVMSFNSVLRFKGQSDFQAIGRKLNVRTVLLGRLTRHGEDLSIRTELIDVQDNRTLWGQQYDRKLDAIQALQEEVSLAVSEQLRIRLTNAEQKLLSKRSTANSEAYQLYILGCYSMRRMTKEGWEKGIECFEQAIQKDPAYAPAYVGLTWTYSELGLRGLMPPSEAQPRAERAALKAVELDDTLAEAHAARGYIRVRDWDWPAAKREFKRALELDPNSRDANMMYYFYLRDNGRTNEALPYAQRTYELDPMSPRASADLGSAYYEARQYGRAIEQLAKTIEMEPKFAPAHARLGAAYLAKGSYREAIEELKKARDIENSPERPGRFAWLAYAYAVSGDRAEAQRMLHELMDLSRRRYIPPYDFALIYAGLGEKDKAFAQLEKAYEEHSQALTDLKADPMFDSLRSDPRFTDLLRRIGLPL